MTAWGGVFLGGWVKKGFTGGGLLVLNGFSVELIRSEKFLEREVR